MRNLQNRHLKPECVYQLFMSMKVHMNGGTYNLENYGLLKRPSKNIKGIGIYERIARKYTERELVPLFLHNFSLQKKPEFFIGDLDHNMSTWHQYWNNAGRSIAQELIPCFTSIKKKGIIDTIGSLSSLLQFNCPHNQQTFPGILVAYDQDIVSLNTLAIAGRELNLFQYWEEEADKIQFPNRTKDFVFVKRYALLLNMFVLAPKDEVYRGIFKRTLKSVKGEAMPVRVYPA